MYVITRYHNNNYEVLLGPIDWNPTFITQVLRSDLDDGSIQVLSSDEARVPYDIYPNVRVRKAEMVYPPINEKLQRFEGPFWTHTDTISTGTYVVYPKPVELLRGELLAQVADKRYNLENSGFTHTINDTKVYISTKREDRNLYSTGIPGYWKFKLVETVPFASLPGSPERDLIVGETWLTLTQEQLDDISLQVKQHVQDAFDWEASKVEEINSKTVIEHLDAIEI